MKCDYVSNKRLPEGSSNSFQFEWW